MIKFSSSLCLSIVLLSTFSCSTISTSQINLGNDKQQVNLNLKNNLFKVKAAIEENDSSINYTGTWNSVSNTSASGGFETISNTLGSVATYNFTGTSIKYLARKDSDQGHVRIYIDSIEEDSDALTPGIQPFDLYSASTLNKEVIFSKSDLSPGTHSISIEYSGTNNPSSSGYGINLDYFETTETLVNEDISSGQNYSDIASDSSNNYIVTWTSYDGNGDGVFARRFNNGVAVGSQFQVNTYTTSNQRRSSVAMNSSGSFVITWYSDGQDGSSTGVYAQIYDSSGNPVGSEFKVNSYTTNQQEYPVVAMNNSGEFVIAWQSKGQDGSDYGVYYKKFNSTGFALTGDLRANTRTINIQKAPAISMNKTTGNFVITWEDSNTEIATPMVKSAWDVMGQRYASNGGALGTEFIVNSSPNNYQWQSDVAMDNSSNFVVTWTSTGGQDGNLDGVYSQRYNSSGAKLGSETKVNTYTYDSQALSKISSDSSGNYVVTWASKNQDGSNFGVYTQRYNNTGTKLGGESQVNTTFTNNQSNPNIVVNSGGDFIITWDGEGAGDSYGVFSQRFDSSGNKLF